MEHSPAPSRERATSPKGDGGAAGAVSTSPGAGVVETVVTLAPTAGPATHVSCSAGFSFLLLRVRCVGRTICFSDARDPFSARAAQPVVHRQDVHLPSRGIGTSFSRRRMPPLTRLKTWSVGLQL